MLPLKNLHEIDAAFLEAHRDLRESQTLEYKEALDLETNRGKESFLAELTGFANTGGGDIIYGLSELRDEEGKQTGYFNEIRGIEIVNLEQLKQQIENILRDTVKPRLLGNEIQEIPLGENRFVLCFRVRKSFQSPHRVELGGRRSFWIRKSSTTNEMDVGELRAAFNSTYSLEEKLQNFRVSFIRRIFEEDAFSTMRSEATLLIQIIPSPSLDGAGSLNFKSVIEKGKLRTPFVHSFDNSIFNFKGFLRFAAKDTGAPYDSFVQLHHNGMIEAGIHTCFRVDQDGPVYFSPYAIERGLVYDIFDYLELLEAELDAPYPLHIAITFINAKGVHMKLRDSFEEGRFHLRPIDQTELILPFTTILEFPPNRDELARKLKETFDRMWFAGGVPGSLDFDENGDWTLDKK